MTLFDHTAIAPRPDATAAWRGPPRLASLSGLMLRSLHAIAPAAAAGVAQALFGRPWPAKSAARKQPVAPGWGLVRWPFEGRGVVTWHRQEADAARPRVLLVHGWAGDAQLFLPFAAALSAAGMEPVLIDMPAHGRSDGRQSSLPHWSRALLEVGAQLGPLHAVVGHSLGALAVAHAAGRGLATHRLALLAPCLAPRACLQAFADGFGLPPTIAEPMQHMLERRHDVALGEFEAERLGAAIAQPTLVLHDRADRIAPFATSLQLALALSDGRLRHVDGVGHRGVLRHADSIGPVVAHLAHAAGTGKDPSSRRGSGSAGPPATPP